jgi:hypothetical protein
MDAIQYVQGHDAFVTAVATVAAAVASICSLLIAGITIREQRAQSRGSVRPIPFISFGDYANQILVSIQNRGVGPLIIDEISVVDRTTKAEKKNVIDFMPLLPEGLFWDDFVQVDLEGRPLAANGEIVLLRFSLPPDPNPVSHQIRKEIRDNLSRLSMSLIVKDVYGSKLKKCTRDFDWFAR